MTLGGGSNRSYSTTGRRAAGSGIAVERLEPAVDIPLVNTVDATRRVGGDLPGFSFGVPLLGSATPLAGPFAWSTERCVHTQSGVCQR